MAMVETPGKSGIPSPVSSAISSSISSTSEEIKMVQMPLPIPQFILNTETNASRLQESTTSSCVFRKHLRLAKNEEKVLKILSNDIDNRTKSAVGVDIADELTDEIALAMNGSKTNLMIDTDNENSSWIPMSVYDLDSHSRVSIEEMISHTMLPYAGKYLLCCNSVLPVLSYEDGAYFLSTIIEDSYGGNKAVRLEIICSLSEAESFFHKVKYPYLNQMEPESTIMIKNPIFGKEVYREDNAETGFCVRAENAQDVAFLPQSFPLTTSWESFETNQSSTDTDTTGFPDNSLTSLWVSCTVENKYAADEWKRWGNEHSICRQYTQALFAYNIAARFDPKSIELVASKSATLINLGLYSAARENVEFLTMQDPYNTGFILRKINCLWGMGNYEEALDYLKELLKHLASHPPELIDLRVTAFLQKGVLIETISQRTHKLIHQSENGEMIYEREKFFKSPAKQMYDEAEYFKPIDVLQSLGQDNPDSSEGYKTMVVANRPIEAGELMIMTKAFTVLFLNASNKLVVDRNDELTNTVIQKIKLEKPTESSFYKLDSTLKNAESSDSLDSVDSVEKLLKLSKDDIRKLCEANFYTGNVTVHPEDSSMRSCRNIGGIWIFPIHIKHACVGGNAIWYTCGNMMFVRAIREIRKNEEIIMAHIEPTVDFETRTKFLDAKNIQCSCSLCLFESTEPEQIKVKRISLLKEMRLSGFTTDEWPSEFTKHELRQLKHCIEDLDILRSAYTRLNFPLVDPLYNYGVYLVSVNSFEEAIPVFEKAFFIVDDTTAIFDLLNISLYLSYCYIACNKKSRDKTKSKKWFNAVKSYAMISYGCLDPVRLNFKGIFDFLEEKRIVNFK